MMQKIREYIRRYPFYSGLVIGAGLAIVLIIIANTIFLTNQRVTEEISRSLKNRNEKVDKRERQREQQGGRIKDLSEFLREDENYNSHPPTEPLKKSKNQSLPSPMRKGLKKVMELEEIQNLNHLIDIEKFIQGNGMIAVINERREVLYIIAGASWYGPRFHRRKMANGKRFNQFNPRIAASNALPLWLKVELTNLATGKKIEATIQDRGPFATDEKGRVIYPLRPRRGKLLDLSRAAAEQLGFLEEGLALLKIKPVL